MYIGEDMTKEENQLLSNIIRTIIRKARKKGYTFRFFFDAINYSKDRTYNFMNHGYHMDNDNLLILSEYVVRTLGEDEAKECADFLSKNLTLKKYFWHTINDTIEKTK